MQSENVLGSEIRAARISANMTQEILAEKMGVTPTHIKHIESGHRKPSVELLFALVKELHISLDKLLSTAKENTESYSYKRCVELIGKCTDRQIGFIIAVIENLLKSNLH